MSLEQQVLDKEIYCKLLLKGTYRHGEVAHSLKFGSISYLWNR